MEVVINTPGTKLSVDNGMLMIRNNDEHQRLPLKSISSILVYRGSSLTSDLIYTAVENNIDILFGTRTGKPVARIWGNQFGSVATIFSDLTDKADLLRGWEGSCSRKYFECINHHLPEQYRFERRSQHPALDMFNSLLNYAYGMLYGKIESAMIHAGIDPFIGMFHRDEYNRPVFVYDIIEIFRYWADITVINLCMQQIIFPEFFTAEHGAYLLNSDGKRILIQSFNDYLDEIVTNNNLERGRITHIDLYLQEIARMFKEYQPIKNRI